MIRKTILAVDDEEHILELLSYNLEKEGYQVITADNGEDAIRLLNEQSVDLVLLDWMLPGIDGIEALRQIRSLPKHRAVPVIMLTAKGDEISKVVGFEIGADDYLSKPFGIHELLARIKALFRRVERPENTNTAADEEIIKLDNVIINKTRRTVMVGNVSLDLSLKEFELLYLLAQNQGIVFTRDTLLERIWGYDYMGETRTVDVHIRNLRKKLELNRIDPELIKTVRGVGYKIK